MTNVFYKCIKIILYAFSLVPLKIGYIFSVFIYVLLKHVVKYRKKTIYANLDLVFPEKTKREKAIIAKKFYRHLSEMFVEIIYSLYISEKEIKNRVRFINPEILNKFYAEGKHIVGVTGHYSNWEWGYGFQTICPYKLMEVYKKMSDKISDRVFSDIRSRFGGTPIEMSSLKIIFAEAKKNPIYLYLLADQSPAGADNLWYYTSFFGVNGTPVFTGPEKIAKKLDAAFVYIDMQKMKRGHYQIEFSVLCDNVRETPENMLTDLYISKLEKIVFNRPEYWMWSHKRWKRRKIME